MNCRAGTNTGGSRISRRFSGEKINDEPTSPEQGAGTAPSVATSRGPAGRQRPACRPFPDPVHQRPRLVRTRADRGLCPAARLHPVPPRAVARRAAGLDARARQLGAPGPVPQRGIRRDADAVASAAAAGDAADFLSGRNADPPLGDRLRRHLRRREVRALRPAAEGPVRLRLLPALRVRGDVPQLRARPAVRGRGVRASAPASPEAVAAGAGAGPHEQHQRPRLYRRHRPAPRPGPRLPAQPPRPGGGRCGGRAEALRRLRRRRRRDPALGAANDATGRRDHVLADCDLASLVVSGVEPGPAGAVSGNDSVRRLLPRRPEVPAGGDHGSGAAGGRLWSVDGGGAGGGRRRLLLAQDGRAAPVSLPRDGLPRLLLHGPSRLLPAPRLSADLPSGAGLGRKVSGWPRRRRRP